MDSESADAIVLSVTNVVGADNSNKLQVLRAQLKDATTTENGAIPVEDMVSALSYFLIRTEALKLNLFPNFFHSWLTGPFGYVLDLNPTSPFDFEPFRAHLFRNICAYEIVYKPELQHLETLAGYRDACRATLPIDPPSPIDIETDTKDSGWSECLGMCGSKIGIYRARDHDEGSQDGYRFFVVVESGLPELTVDQLTRYLFKLSVDNHAFLKGDRANLDLRQPLTYEDVLLKGGSAMERLREISLENNKRLAYRFISECGLQPVSGTAQFQSGPNPYRHSAEEIVAERHGALLDQAIDYWLKFSPVICPWSRLQHLPLDADTTQETKAVYPSEQLLKYPLGSVLESIDPLKRIEILKEREVQFQTHPRTYEPLLRVEFNTFRPIGQTAIRWYCGCSPAPSDGAGLIRPLQPGLGYEIVGSKFLYATNGDAGIPWENNFSDAFPVQFKFAVNAKDTHASAQTQFVYCSLFHGISKSSDVAPRQLRGSCTGLSDFKPGSLPYTQVFTSRGRASVTLDPVFVYLSPKPQPETDLELITADIYKQ